MWRRLLIVSGLAAAIAFFLRRRRPAWEEPHVADDPAGELRRKLDEARDRGREQEDEAPDALEDLDARRRTVHAKARQAADEMRRSTE